MRIITIVIYLSLFTLAASISSCKKDDTSNNWVHAYINVPFEMTPAQPAYIYDTLFDTTNSRAIRNRIEVKVQSIEDIRSFGADCSSSTGGSAKMRTQIIINDTVENICVLNMPGCTHNDEWDVHNSNTPNCQADDYAIYLLKLNPYDKRPSKLSDYSVKYIVKHK